MKFTIAASLLTVATALASNAPSHHLMEKRDSAPKTWVSTAAAAADKKIHLTFYLTQPAEGVKSLERELLTRSNPNHENYGKWLSNEEVHSMVAPSQESINAVYDFLNNHSDAVIPRTINEDVITATVSVETAEKLLNTKYEDFKHTETGSSITRCHEYSLPSELKGHVSLVGPTTRFPSPSSTLKTMTDIEDVGAAANSPDNLRALYSIGDTLGGESGDNVQAVTAFLAQYYSEDDLNQFFKEQLPSGAATPIKLVGDATTGKPGVESMLDIEYMPALGALNPTEFWGFSGSSPMDDADEPFLTWLYQVSNTTDDEVPLIFSTSYGEDETAEVPSDYADRINVEFMKSGARGISILFASGDSGAASDKHTCPGSKFTPMWPAGSPYVTAVGGTEGGSMPETAWSGSSGGFSNMFGTPDWQSDAVNTFLASDDENMPPSSYYNSTGRGFPDISAAAVGYPVVCNGRTQSVAGTSCASPCAGGIFGLLNDKRLAAGKSSLGFLNPMLYANAEAMNDVKLGVQGGCLLKQKGFPAIEGWDAVTGLGTPNYEKLLDVVMALP